MIAFRPTLMISMPSILADLGLSNSDGGVLLSTCQISYMFAKPVSQVLSDNVDAIALLLLSELATCACFCFLPFAKTLGRMQLLFAFLMICQAPHAPAANRLVTTNFAAKERGTAFSALNAAANAVSCALPLVVAYGTIWLGSWMRLFVAIGAATGTLALVQAFYMKDAAPRAPVEKRPPASLWTVASTRAVWTIGLNYFLLYFVRMGIEGWIGTYFVERHKACAVSVASFLCSWQLGGVLGSTVAGPVADNRRGSPALIGATFAAVLLAAVGLLGPLSSRTAAAAWQVNGLALVGGFAVYGTRILLTLSTRLFFQPRECGKADAITNALGELGGAVAGVPLIRFVQSAGNWHAYTNALAAGAATLCAAHLALVTAEHKLLGNQEPSSCSKTP
ncbi:hypothetical protein CTAYLR_004357 [Chrysophaeum taylorii]|uniref:Major facilitator superfamily (MFS) profile domain-containing protein n=1 Tax=Chrysophaeum taylorii TaxID=2483200 RepID=A0AAD7XPI8_9STRA|nr:hypothetical protein CTAYLR_004357 [Chrysophaeum taylorii]